jgi:hypothetical protein
VNNRRVSGIAGGKLFVVIHNQLDRLARFLGQKINDGEIHEISLAAEIAADVHGIENKFLLRDLQRIGDLLADAVGDLAAGPEFCRAVRRRFDDARMRFDVTVMHHRGSKAIFDDDVRLAKAGFDVSPAPGHIDKIVAGLLERLGKTFVIHYVRMNQPRARLHGLHRIENRLRLLVFHFDKIHRLFGDQLGVRRHRGHFFTDEPHFAVGEDRHVVKPAADFQSAAILARHHGVNAGESQRLARVDSLYSSGRNRAA